MTRTFLRTSAIVAAVAAGLAIAGVADLLTMFQAGEPIVADEVNGNFTTVAAELDALAQDVAELEARFGATRAIPDGRPPGTCVLGDVWLTANVFAPDTVADGRLLDIATNTALFSLIGTTYGGDGRTTFALPDLRDVAPRSAGGPSLSYVICTVGTYPTRN